MGIRRAWICVLGLVCGVVFGGETAAVRIALTSPTDFQVVQRFERGLGRVVVAGALDGSKAASVHKLEARFVGTSIQGPIPDEWTSLPADPRVRRFRAELTVPAGGWYVLEVRASGAAQILADAKVGHVGVGEIFFVVGQSNSANYGSEKLSPQSGRVAAFSGSDWRIANDPQPGAGGNGGSFMAPFGDALAERLGVPIGLVATGIGATSVREWQPAGTPLSNLPTLTGRVIAIGSEKWVSDGAAFETLTARMKQLGPQGFRAVLWHQGESDAHQKDSTRTLSGENYRKCMELLIQSSRKECGWEAPWFVAQVSFNGSRERSSPDIRAAQKALWDSGLALQGPDTDALTGDLRDGVHFNGKGLREHARLWAEKVGPWVEAALKNK